MAAPTSTTRGTPSGADIPDGYQALLTLSNVPTIAFFEKEVQPPGVDGGEAIDTTTMHNAAYRTMRARSLKTLEDHTIRVAYDPTVYITILAQINIEQTITITFPDGNKLPYFGYMRRFTPDRLVEGSHPMADVTIVPTNYDPANNVEAGPGTIGTA